MKSEKFNRGRSTKGYTLVEMVVVIAIIALSVTLIGGSVITVYSARAKKAAGTVEALIAQAKINALSGMDVYLKFEYDTDKNEYVGEIIRKEKQADDSIVETVYEQQKFGNRLLNFSVDGHHIKPEEDVAGKTVTLAFNMTTGAVSVLKSGDTSIISGSKHDFVLSSGSTYTVTLYTSTGEHIME